MTRPARVFARVVATAWGRADRDRRREELEADLEGAAELGLSRAAVGAGQLRAAASTVYEGEIVPRPIGPLAIALRLGHARRGPVLLVLLASVSAVLAGIGMLLAR